MSSRTATVLVLVGVTAFAINAFSMEAPDVPHHLVLVGVVRTPDNAQLTSAIVNTAEGAGYRVEVLSSPDAAARDWLAEKKQLDALVRPTWDPSAKKATALVFFRGFTDPRSVQRVGGDAGDAAAAAVVEILSGSALMLGPVGGPTTATQGNATGPK